MVRKKRKKAASAPAPCAKEAGARVLEGSKEAEEQQGASPSAPERNGCPAIEEIAQLAEEVFALTQTLTRGQEAARDCAFQAKAARCLIRHIDLIDMFLLRGRKRRSLRRPEARALYAVRRGMLVDLASWGVEAMVEIQGSVDYHRHDVLAVAPTEEPEKDGLIDATLQRGYLLEGRVLRPAQVTVFRYEHPKETTHQPKQED